MPPYVQVVGLCYLCRGTFAFSPTRVPSVRDPRTNEREPICAECVARVNPIRVARGLDPIVVLPGAYDADDQGEDWLSET